LKRPVAKEFIASHVGSLVRARVRVRVRVRVRS